MKKTLLYQGIAMMVLGASLIALCMLIPGLRHRSSTFFGFGGGLIGPGLISTVRYLRGSGPNASEEAAQLLRELETDRTDERKIMLRDKSRSIAWVIGIVSLLSVMAWMVAVNLSTGEEVDQTMLLVLYILFWINILSPTIAYHILNKRL